ncbi:cGMP-inhibited 3',5'-cyclic phosphodiesterase 3A-like isoform X2 [Branchiostoma floridae x Branchiostoma belcheri]
MEFASSRETRSSSSYNNGYVPALVRPLEPGREGSRLALLLPSPELGMLPRWGWGLALGALLASLWCESPWQLARGLVAVLLPLCSVTWAFCGLAFYYRRAWRDSNVYLMFGGLCLVEFFVQVTLGETIGLHLFMWTLVAFLGLTVLFPIVRNTQYTSVGLSLVGLRVIIGLSPDSLPGFVRPFLGYVCCLCGYVLSCYLETVMKSSMQFSAADPRISVMRRRRSSQPPPPSSHHRHRRTSLPALSQRNQLHSVVDTELMREAHGMVTDMLTDPCLPPTVISGLRTISNLLSPPSQYSHKPKLNYLVELAETGNISDTEESLSPYTGERPSALPKRLRRSLPISLIRRMSTTWTTTTSATGMPTLEPEPSRMRSASLRQPREGPPVTGNSLGYIKPRSFSTSASSAFGTMPLNAPFRRGRGSWASGDFSPTRPVPSPYSRTLSDETDLIRRRYQSSLENFAAEKQEKRETDSPGRQVTSDYDSADANNSDSSDNLPQGEECPAVEPEQPDGVEDETVTQKETKEDDTEEAVSMEEYLKTVDDNVLLERLYEWDFPVFDLEMEYKDCILSMMAYRVFQDTGLFEAFRVPKHEFMSYFRALENGYRDVPYHNRVHAADVLHACWWLTTQPIPGFTQVPLEEDEPVSKDPNTLTPPPTPGLRTPRASFTGVEESYGILGMNFPALELMALYVAAAMHDYDHPGRTNAFLVATSAPQAVLYNDRSVLENHHAAAAWALLLFRPELNFLCHLETAEFKRFRFLVIEAILATDLKRHFDFLTEFNAKLAALNTPSETSSECSFSEVKEKASVANSNSLCPFFHMNEDDSPGIDWRNENDRLLVVQMCIKLADVNGPCKAENLHITWTNRIVAEFYEQGDDEAGRGLPISPYMDRNKPFLARLQESFINHLVAPLCNAYAAAGLLPGHWVEEEEDLSSTAGKADSENEASPPEDDDSVDDDATCLKKELQPRKVTSPLTENIKRNHQRWLQLLKEEEKEEQQSAERDESKREFGAVLEEGEEGRDEHIDGFKDFDNEAGKEETLNSDGDNATEEQYSQAHYRGRSLEGEKRRIIFESGTIQITEESTIEDTVATDLVSQIMEDTRTELRNVVGLTEQGTTTQESYDVQQRLEPTDASEVESTER